MRVWILVLLVGCASGKDMAPAGSAETPKTEQVAMGGAPSQPAPRAAGDPCEGGQVAPTADKAEPAKPAVVATSGAPAGGIEGGGGPMAGGQSGVRGGGLSQGAPDGDLGLGTGAGAGGLRGRRVAPEPRVAFGTVKVEGALAQEIVRRIVRQHVAQLRQCYEAQLKKNPSLNGLVVVHFVIDPSGNVPNAQVSKSIDSDLDACFIARMKTITFPKPENGGNVNVELPLNLSQPY